MRLLTVACACLLLTACSGGSTPSAAPTTPVPTVTTSSPTPLATTPAPVVTTTPPSPTAAARRKPAIDGDVDGDGTADLIRTHGSQLLVELSSTGQTISAPVHRDGPQDATVLGSKDVDRDGYAEVFLQTAAGASTTFATPYRFDGKVLHELQLDGGPARLGIGGTVTHGDGFACLPTGRLQVRSADSPDGGDYTVHVLVYRLTTTELLLVSSTTSHAKQGDPAVEQSYQVDCGSVGDGG